MYDQYLPTFKDIFDLSNSTGKPLIRLPYNDKMAKESINFLIENGYATKGQSDIGHASCSLTPSGYEFLQNILK